MVSLRKTANCKVTFTDGNIGLEVVNANATIKVDKRSRKLAYRTLRQTVAYSHWKALTEKRSMGRNCHLNCHLKQNNQFCSDGKYISHASFKWIHKARLNLQPVRCNRLTNHSTQTADEMKCRICGYPKETLAHVLNQCKPALGKDITARHNAVQDQVVEYAKAHDKKLDISVNKQCNVAGRKLLPDIVIRNEKDKKVFIIDVTCPFNSDMTTFHNARQGKIAKYKTEADKFTSLGYEVGLDAIVVGSLGVWDKNNSRILNKIGIPWSRQQTLIRKTVQSTIDYSRTIYWAHVLEKYNFRNMPKSE
jgi:hypothetical protein